MTTTPVVASRDRTRHRSPPAAKEPLQRTCDSPLSTRGRRSCSGAACTPFAPAGEQAETGRLAKESSRIARARRTEKDRAENNARKEAGSEAQNKDSNAAFPKSSPRARRAGRWGARNRVLSRRDADPGTRSLLDCYMGLVLGGDAANERGERDAGWLVGRSVGMRGCTATGRRGGGNDFWCVELRAETGVHEHATSCHISCEAAPTLAVGNQHAVMDPLLITPSVTCAKAW